MPKTPKLNLDIALQPKQSKLLRMFGNPALRWIGYGGSRGGGKSGAIRRIALIRRLEFKGSKCAIFRRTFPDLDDNHIQPFWRDFPELQQFYNAGKKSIMLPKALGGGVIAFRYAERTQDVLSIIGQEYMDILIDQSEEWSEAELHHMQTNNRFPGVPDNSCKMGLFFNPGGKCAAFLKRVLVDRKFKQGEDGSQFAFLQAYGWDNVEWARGYLDSHRMTDDDFYELSDNERFEIFIHHTQYGDILNKLPPALRIGHLMGDFDSFAGQYFDIFDREKHTLRPELMGLKPWFPRWISMDWGFVHPSAVHWHAQGEERTFTYREFMRDQMSPKALAQEIVDRSQGEKISAVYLSPDAFARKTSERTIADQVGDVFAQNGIPRPAPADNDRVGGWMLMYESLKNDQWVIGSNCANLIETLPLMTRDPKNVEDCIKFDASEGQFNGDDSADDCRYGLKSHLGSRQKPHSAVRQEELAKSTDFTDMHFRAIKFDSRYLKARRAQPRWRH